LIGPDPGVRWNYRIGRFIKSYLRHLAWHDDLYYVQAQSYWILANWRLYAITADQIYRDIAIQCARDLLSRQLASGAWMYPNPEWKGRIANAEGTWGSLGLLETYRQTGDVCFLFGALKWYQFLLDFIGFQSDGATLAVNYFANRADARVPNNTAFVLRFLAELTDVTGNESCLSVCAQALSFMISVQMPDGEFPYAVPGEGNKIYREHFQCFQYNAFQCLDLCRYYQLTGDSRALPVLERVGGFLQGGIGADGHVFYECGKPYRTVTYHTAATAAALAELTAFGLLPHSDWASRAYSYVLALQRADGSFPHSSGDYHLFTDQRSYPRYLAMILYHLLNYSSVTEAAHSPLS
jgi:hypothetical protein